MVMMKSSWSAVLMFAIVLCVWRSRDFGDTALYHMNASNSGQLHTIFVVFSCSSQLSPCCALH
jgi:hypothetical protein